MTEPATTARPSCHAAPVPPGSLATPILGGVLGAAALVALYLGLITMAESWRHALDQLRTDAVWVGLVALGLAVQVGLYIRVRQVVRGNAAAGGALTGAGTGTSTAGMIACCAHHVADIAPFIGLTGCPSSSKSGSSPPLVQTARRPLKSMAVIDIMGMNYSMEVMPYICCRLHGLDSRCTT